MEIYILQNKPGERMAIVRLLSDKESGVLILLDRKETTGPFVITRDDTKLPIIALRQPPELCGIDEPELDREEKENWTQSYRKQFCDSLQKVIHESGINKLIIVDGDNGKTWEASPYSKLVYGVEVQDAQVDIFLGK